MKEEPAGENRPVFGAISAEKSSEPEPETKDEASAETETVEPAIEAKTETASDPDTSVDITVEDIPTEKVDELKAGDTTKVLAPESAVVEVSAVADPAPAGEAKSEPEAPVSAARDTKVEGIAETEKPEADEELAEKPGDRVEEEGDQEIRSVAEVRFISCTWGSPY